MVYSARLVDLREKRQGLSILSCDELFFQMHASNTLRQWRLMVWRNASAKPNQERQVCCCAGLCTGLRIAAVLALWTAVRPVKFDQLKVGAALGSSSRVKRTGEEGVDCLSESDTFLRFMRSRPLLQREEGCRWEGSHCFERVGTGKGNAQHLLLGGKGARALAATRRRSTQSMVLYCVVRLISPPP